MAMITAVNEFLDDLRGGKMSEPPIVSVEHGQLQGRVVPSPSVRCYYSFQGIPYAKPPLGSLRFKAPQPVEPWQGIYDASAEGNVSAQIDTFIHKQYIGDENCLFLNVYTPNLDGEFLPVMVYIHGGGFRHGSGNTSLYGPDYLVEKDVVIVTINYRCGALGFLGLDTVDVPGNAGLKDMVQALRWVKNNIHNFGGNSGNITLFGESAGGVAVSLLTASPLTKELVNKAIIQSGTALNSWGIQKNPIDNARKLAKALGCDSEDTDDVLQHLLATSAKDIVEAHSKIHPPEVFYEKAANTFAPVIEKEFKDVEAFLTENFIDVLTSGRVAEIPVMIGSNALEFTWERTIDDLQTFIPEDLNISRNSEESLAVAERIKDLYFKGKPIGVETLTEYFQILSDRLINIDTHRYVNYLIHVSKHPIYLYKFDYVGELNLTKKLLASLGLKHAGHMDELGYLFNNVVLKDAEPTPEDLKMRETMLRLWTNFAKSGNPTPEENHYITVTWLPVTQDNLYYLNLGSELSLSTNPDKEKMEFWDELYRKHYKIWEQNKVNNEEVCLKQSSDVTETTATEPENIPETIVTEAESIPETIVTEAENIPETIVTEAESIPETIVTEAENIPETIVTEAESIPETIVTEAENIPETILTEAENIPETIVTEAENIPETIVTEAENIPETIVTEDEKIPVAIVTEAENILEDNKDTELLESVKIDNHVETTDGVTVTSVTEETHINEKFEQVIETQEFSEQIKAEIVEAVEKADSEKKVIEENKIIPEIEQIKVIKENKFKITSNYEEKWQKEVEIKTIRNENEALEDEIKVIQEEIVNNGIKNFENKLKETTNGTYNYKSTTYANGGSNGVDKNSRPLNEVKMSQSNGEPRDVIRASDPPEDDLPKNIGVNKFVNFFESLGGKK